MSFVPCSGCGARPKGKLASVYSAWFEPNGERVCWVQKLCATCLMDSLGFLRDGTLQASLDLTACPICGADSSQDLQPEYLTLYLPKREPEEFALTTCGSCAVPLRQQLQVGASQARDRGGLGPQAPTQDPFSAWGASPAESTESAPAAS